MHCVLATEQFVRFQTGCLLWTVEVLRKDTVVIWANIIAQVSYLPAQKQSTERKFIIQH